MKSFKSFKSYRLIFFFDGSPSDAFEGVVINNSGFRCGDYMEKACDYIKDNMK